MATYFYPQDLSPSDFPVFLMSPQATGDVTSTPLGLPFINTAAGYGDCGRQEEQFTTQFFAPDTAAAAAAAAAVQQTNPMSFMTASRTHLNFFPDNYSQGMITMQNVCTPSSRISPSPAAVPQALFPIQTGTQFFSSPLQFQAQTYEQLPEIQQESVFCRAKRQRDENYRYSLGCISRRVRSWLEKSKPYASAAQTNLEDQLVQDTIVFDGYDENLYELFDEPRRKRFCSSFGADGTHVSASATHSESTPTGPNVPSTAPNLMSDPLLIPSHVYPETLMGSISVSEDLHGSSLAEQEFVVKFPKQIPAICPTNGIKVQFEELTDRSVLRNWRCRTDEADVIFRKGRKRFFKRVAVLPPDSWQPNKRPQTWEWAPSGPFALHLGEYVSISGTNGYPYEIVLIRHIPPALRCFLSLVPVPREMAKQMLNGETIEPESAFIVHTPVDSVTHKWILNGIRPRDYTRDMAMEYINKDIEMERIQKEKRKVRKNSALSLTESPALDSSLLRLDSVLVTSSEEDLAKSSGSNDCAPAAALVI